MNFTRTVLAFCVVSFLPASLQAEPITPQDLEFFESKVRPVLSENCFKCHSAREKIRGGLRLDGRAFALKGGDTGPAVVPGHPDKSPLVKAIGYLDPELKMPPRGKLSADAIANLTEWVRRGAPWPDEKLIAKGPKSIFDLKERSRHWSLQPLKSPAIPASSNPAWAKSPVDHFLLAGLDAKNLKPASPADKHTLLRRVTFDLTGLPPTPDEIDAFVKDAAPDAYEKVVDRLLASPRYGERWARHWLDLVRYAETMGHEFDFEIPDAWQYRDYVIRAFNNDIPFNRFVTEHIAGDLLPDPRRDPATNNNESILGTMFWLLGEAKHSPVDSRADQADRIDNQIDVFGKSFLGMTIACARCHDHKFDAITTKDYYSLAGYIQSSRPNRAILDDPAPRHAILNREREVLEGLYRLGTKQAAEQLRARGAEMTAPLGALFKDATKPTKLTDDAFSKQRAILLTRMEAEKTRHDQALAKSVLFADARRDQFQDWIASGEAFSFPARTPHLAFDFGRTEAVARLLPTSRASSHLVRDEAVGVFRSPTFTITKNNIHYRIAGKNVRVNLILDGLQFLRDPIYGRLTFSVNTKETANPRKGGEPDPKSPRLALESRDPQWQTQNVSMWLGQRAYIEILDDGPSDVTLDQVIFSDEGAPPAAPNKILLDLLKDSALKSWDAFENAYKKQVEHSLDLWQAEKLLGKADAADRMELLNDQLQSPRRVDAPVKTTPWETYPNHAAWDKLANQYKTRATLNAPRRAMTFCDGSAVNEQVFIRGNSRTLGEEAPRRFLEIFGGVSPGLDEKGSGRLALAARMVDPAQTPILPRVIVNRLWKHHFGEGIVRSVDDFGVLGQTPSHPELLDYLATDFIKNDWSIKKMTRALVLSAAYQMSSAADKEADAADPENRLWHRMPIRRLEAEAIRDSLLAVSGRLTDDRYGPPVPTHLTAHMLGRGRPGASGPLDGNGRRAIYISVRRNFLNPMFLAFDFPTPFSTIGRRTVSNVPAQALTMLNNPLVLQQAEVWTKQVLAKPGLDRKGRIEAMYLRALGRPAQPAETTLAVAFLEAHDRDVGRVDDPRGWTELAHVIFNLKEFIFIP